MKALELTEEEVQLLYDAVCHIQRRYFKVISTGSDWPAEDRAFFEQKSRKYRDLGNKLRESLPKKKGE